MWLQMQLAGRRRRSMRSGLIMKLIWICAVLFCAQQQLVAGKYIIDDTQGLGRRFDGIGGLSGGGVSVHIIIVQVTL